MFGLCTVQVCELADIIERTVVGTILQRWFRADSVEFVDMFVVFSVFQLGWRVPVQGSLSCSVKLKLMEC